MSGTGRDDEHTRHCWLMTDQPGNPVNGLRICTCPASLPPEEVRAITVKQPWAWAIAHGGKLIENRSRGTSYRGQLLIHAGKAWSDRGGEDQRVLHAWTAWLSHRPIETAHEEHLREPWERADYLDPTDEREQQLLDRSAVIAVAQLVDAHPDAGCCRPWGESSYEEGGGKVRTNVHHLVLEDVRPLSRPLPARGQLGLWTPTPDLVNAALAATHTPEETA